MKINELDPRVLWKHFYNLTQIPRPSHHEEKAREYVIEFAKSLQLDYSVDKTGNVIIRKAASEGFEKHKTLTLQSHLDIVPQKNTHIKHDFVTDPLDVFIDGDWVTAKDTTLGSDNGIGVAASLAVLESEDIKHGPLEALFTINEEAGMEGAFGLEPGVLQGDILLNLDSEDEGELFVGCAGGINVTGILQLLTEEVPENHSTHDIAVTGLKGGHSGLDINLERGNANKILFRLLKKLVSEFGVRLVSVNGGSLRNAIPREAFATITIPDEQLAKIKKAISTFGSVIQKEYSATEPDVKTEINASAESAEYVMHAMVQDDLIHAITACPNGVHHMSADMPGTVETSNNLAIVKSDAEKIEILNLARSFSESRKQALVSEIESVLLLAGCKIIRDGNYPGWNPNPTSGILGTMKKIYEDNWGKTPAVKAIHAGLECGIIGSKYPDMDMISFGPTIRFPHSPDEKVNIKTVNEFWKWLVLTLEKA
ncbi:aminoacyl-histidine dipeptidase [Saccharicrinis sp. FJH54]|uniref:aminoacyl-histidine dipeptidase n=1 Tax=Saccharicrinis sp. FJH54 TaxID=3344665 RepID=UPI0035D46904